MDTDGWEPGQYERFKAERSQPFHDLVALLRPAPGGRAVDLGCGTGELTRVLHEQVGAAETVGIDSSASMFGQAGAFAGGGLSFAAGDIAEVDLDRTGGPVDVVFANAALQWVPDHEAVLERWVGLLCPGGQLAVQVPANLHHPSHRVIAELATEAPFVDAGDGPPPEDPVRSVLAPERYAEVLHRLGFADQHVRLQVYGHVLPAVDDVVEWTKGTSLTRMRRHFSTDVYDAFVAAYRDRRVAELGDQRPYFYAFRRILMWATR